MSSRKIKGRKARVSKHKSPYYVKVIDNTGDSNPKRVLICQKSISGEAASSVINWRDVVTCHGQSFKIRFNAPLSISVTQQASPDINYPTCYVSNNHTYEIVDDVVASTGSSSPTEFSFHNNSEDITTVNVCKDKHVLATIDLDPDDTYDFDYRPTIYIQASNDLEAIVDPNDANTQISLFGIKNASIIMTQVDDTYSFTLSDIVS